MSVPSAGYRWLGPLLAGYWLFIFFATHLPSGALPPTALGDKLEHFIAYGILGFLLVCWIGFTARRAWVRRAAPYLGIAVCVVYAAVDEATQPIVGRYADFGDFLADAVGASVGALAGMVLLARVRRSPPEGDGVSSERS